MIHMQMPPFFKPRSMRKTKKPTITSWLDTAAKSSLIRTIPVRLGMQDLSALYVCAFVTFHVAAWASGAIVERASNPRCHARRCL